MYATKLKGQITHDRRLLIEIPHDCNTTIFSA